MRDAIRTRNGTVLVHTGSLLLYCGTDVLYRHSVYIHTSYSTVRSVPDTGVCIHEFKIRVPEYSVNQIHIYS